MNYKMLLPLFSFGLLSVCVNAQKVEIKSSQTNINLELNDEIFTEAAIKNIDSDRAFISFIMTKKCEVTDFKISKQAILKSFNLTIEKEKDKIIEQLKKIYECKSETDRMFKVPIYIRL